MVEQTKVREDKMVIALADWWCWGGGCYGLVVSEIGAKKQRRVGVSFCCREGGVLGRVRERGRLVDLFKFFVFIFFINYKLNDRFFLVH